MLLSTHFRAKTMRACLVSLVFAAGCGSNDTGGSTAEGAGTATADWKMLGFDSASTYFNSAETRVSVTSAPNLTKAWEFDGGGTVTSTPVVAGGTAYVLSQGLFALDLATGATKWSNPDLTGYASLALDGDALYIHDLKGVLHAVSAKDGKEAWQVKTDDETNLTGFSSPIVTNDYIFIGGSTMEEVSAPTATFRGFVAAFKKDGTLAWKKYTVEEPCHGATLWSSVSVDEPGGLVFAATGNNHGPPAGDTSDGFLAMPLPTGDKFVWKQQIFQGDIWMQSGTGSSSPDNDFGANPIVFDTAGKKLVAGGNKGGDFWVLNRTTGEVLKKRNLGPASSFKGGVFISGSWDGTHLLTVCNGATSTGAGSETAPAASAATLFALDPLTLDIVWEREVTGPVFSPISVANGVGFFGKNKTLQAFDTETGAVLLEFPTEATIATAPAVSNGYVVFGSGMTWIGSTGGKKYYALKVP